MSGARADSSFAASTVLLAGLAARALGWRPHEFWAATPAELALSLGAAEPVAPPPSRSEMLSMIERDSHARPR